MKVGDRVRNIGGMSGAFVGRIGRIVRINRHDRNWPIKVQFDGVLTSRAFSENELEIVNG